MGDDCLCVVCLEHRRETAFHPCRHTVCCQVCAALLKSCDDPCPFCREPITSWELGNFEATRMNDDNATTHRSASASSTVSSDEEAEGPLGNLRNLTSFSLSTSASSASLGYCHAADQPCVVCFTAKPEVFLLPCGHKACCIVCATILKDDNRPCPVCDAAFTACKLIDSPPQSASRSRPSSSPQILQRTATPPSRTTRCVSCLGSTADVELRPCGHVACLLCGSLLKDMGRTCPACNAPVADLRRRSPTPPLGSPAVPREPPQSPPPEAASRLSGGTTVSRRLLYPTFGSRFVSNRDEDYVVSILSGTQVVVTDRSGTVLLQGWSHFALRGFNYKFYARQRPGVGAEGLVLQIKGRGSASAPYYEILTPPPKFVLATCKGKVGRTHIWAHIFPRNQHNGPLLCEVLGILADARFSVKGAGGELLGHIAQGNCSPGHVTLGVHVSAQRDALLLWMLAVLCTCLPSEPGAAPFPQRTTPDATVL
eukprot:GGOE01061883.1.p1 GENE.GGOE01061883.1~~GGOE01061883.1.p1  ORF type:complete len:500 (-),score=89.74 GGOE01061883.1:95-1543(-)